MEVKAVHRNGARFDVIAGNHRVICDQPKNNGGEDAGMTPPEFLLASLATCAGYYAQQYLKTRSLRVDNLEVRVTAEKAMNPARLGSFRIQVHTPGLEPRYEEGLLRAVKACLIHNTLLHAPSIDVELLRYNQERSDSCGPAERSGLGAAVNGGRA